MTPNFTQQTDAAEPPSGDSKDPNSFASRVRDYWARRQEVSSGLPPFPADSIMTEHLREERRVTRNIERGASSDPTPPPAEILEKRELAKKKSQYYDDAFAFRESNTSARERVHRESMVMVELRTNVIISDEYTFIAELSHNLSNRYQRPESSILISLTHSLCLLLGGSFDPAYTMTVTALPSQVQPVTNKRNAILLAKLLEESLGVPSTRSLIKFIGVQEENFAYNGRTAAAEIEDMEKDTAYDHTAMKRTLSRLGPKSATKTQSRRSLRNLKEDTVGGSSVVMAKDSLSPASQRSGRVTPSYSEKEASLILPGTPTALPDRFNTTANPIPPVPSKMTAMDRKAIKGPRVGRRKSFISGFFGR